MYWLKSCTRCHGDLHEVHDVGVHYVSCLQCGRILTNEQEEALPQATLRPLPRRMRQVPLPGAA